MINAGDVVLVESGCVARQVRRGERWTAESVTELGPEYSGQIKILLSRSDRKIAWYARHRNRLCDPEVRLNDGNPLHVIRISRFTGSRQAVLAEARQYPHVARGVHHLSMLKSTECPCCRERVSPTSWEIHAVTCPALINAVTPDLRLMGWAITQISRDAGVTMTHLARATDHAITELTEQAQPSALARVLSYDGEGEPVRETDEIDRVAIECKRIG